MVQIDVPAAFVVGLFSIDIGRRALSAGAEEPGGRKPAAYYRFLFRSILFAGLVIAPAGTYLLAGWPGWENIYWFRQFEHVKHSGWANPLFPALFVVAIVLAGYLGHLLGYRMLVSGKAKYLRPTWIGVLVLVTIVVLATHPSFLLVGTYDQYHQLAGHSRDAMASVRSNPDGFSVAWLGVMVYFVVGFGVLIWRIRADASS